MPIRAVSDDTGLRLFDRDAVIDLLASAGRRALRLVAAGKPG